MCKKGHVFNGMEFSVWKQSRMIRLNWQKNNQVHVQSRAVHLHEHIARGLDFLPIETNHARLFSYGNLLPLKMCLFLHIF